MYRSHNSIHKFENKEERLITYSLINVPLSTLIVGSLASADYFYQNQ